MHALPIRNSNHIGAQTQPQDHQDDDERLLHPFLAAGLGLGLLLLLAQDSSSFPSASPSPSLLHFASSLNHDAPPCS